MAAQLARRVAPKTAAPQRRASAQQKAPVRQPQRPSNQKRTVVKGPTTGKVATVKAAAARVANKNVATRVAVKVANKAAVQPAKRAVAAKRAQNSQVASAVSKGVVKQRVANKLEAAPKVRALTAEYLIAVVLSIIILVYTDGSYASKMKTFIVQFTGISAVFFVMSLLGVSEKAAKTVIMFGILIDLAILFRLSPSKLSAAPTANEMKTEASPYYIEHPVGINTANATPPPKSGTVTGNTQNAKPIIPRTQAVTAV